MNKKIILIMFTLIVLSSFTSGDYIDDMNSNLKHAYSFDTDSTDGKGTVDLSPYSAPTRSSGDCILGSCYTFASASSQYLKSTTQSSAFSEISISFWVKQSTRSRGSPIEMYYNTDNRVQILAPDGLDMRFNIKESASWGTFNLIGYTDTNWTHFVYVADGVNFLTYKNGILDDNTTDANTPFFQTWIYFATDYSTTDYWDGSIDETYIFNVGIGQQEIDFLFNEGAPTLNQQYPFVNDETPITASLIYPINGSIYYGNYNGSIVLTTNKDANCSINDTRWDLEGNQDTIKFNFLNNSEIDDRTIYFEFYCVDSTLNWSNGTGVWFTQYNQLNISVYDADTSDLINQTVNILITDENNLTQTNSTNNGTIMIDDLIGGNYTLRFSSNGYTGTTYTIILGYGNVINLNAYMENASNIVIFTVQDKDTSTVIEDATVTIKRYIGDELQTINVLQTDITGRVLFYYVADELYQFLITKTNYEDKAFSLDPIIFDTYIINMDKSVSLSDSSDYGGLSLYHSPKNFIEGLNNLSFTISSSDGELEYYWINISYPGGANSTYGNNAYGSNLITYFNISGATFTDKVNIIIQYKSTRNNETKSFKYRYGIIVNPTDGTFSDIEGKTYGLGILERLLIFTIILIFFGGIAFYFGGAYGGAGISALIIGFMIKIGFVPLIVVIIPIIWIVVLLAWGGNR